MWWSKVSHGATVPSGPDLEVGERAADAGLGPVRVRRADVALDLVEPAPGEPRRREGGAAGLPVGEVAARLEPAAVHAGDPADQLRVARRELQDDVAAPRLAGDDRPLEPSRSMSAARSSATVGDVVRSVRLRRATVPPQVDGERRVAGARPARPATPSHIRAFEARPWTSRKGGAFPARCRPPSVRHMSTASSTPSATRDLPVRHRVRRVGIRPAGLHASGTIATTWAWAEPTPSAEPQPSAEPAPSEARRPRPRGSRSSTARWAGPPGSRVASVGHVTPAPGASGITNRPRISTTANRRARWNAPPSRSPARGPCPPPRRWPRRPDRRRP